MSIAAAVQIQPAPSAVPIQPIAVSESSSSMSLSESLPFSHDQRFPLTPVHASPLSQSITSPSDFIYPSFTLEINNSKPQLIGSLKHQQDSLNIEWIHPPYHETVSNLTPFPFPSKASLLYNIMSNLPLTLNLPQGIIQQSSNTSIPELSTSYMPGLDPIIDPSSSIDDNSHHSVPSQDQDIHLNVINHSSINIQSFTPVLHINRLELGSLLLNRPDDLRGDRSNAKPRFKISNFTPISKPLVNQSLIAIIVSIVQYLLQRYDGVTIHDNGSSFNDHSSDVPLNGLSPELQYVAVSIIRDLKFFPLWIVGYLSDIFDCR